MASDWSAVRAGLRGCGGGGGICLGPKTNGLPAAVVGRVGAVGDASMETE